MVAPKSKLSPPYGKSARPPSLLKRQHLLHKHPAAEKEPLLSLNEQLATFWQAGDALASFRVNPTPPEIDKAILKRLGDAPFTVGTTNIATLLAKAYDVVDASALRKVEEGET